MESNLISLNLKCVYDSEIDNLVEDVFVPLLSNSKNYYRGVGFFSSGWLSLASEGLAELISSGGKAHIIMSPILDVKDWESIVNGYNDQYTEFLNDNLERSVDEIKKNLKSETLNTFAWLISDNLIELRFAIPRKNYSGGDYHDKIAIFMDDKNNVVAVHGSQNDSIKGSLNGEALSVFKSWDDGQYPFVENHLNRLIALWKNQNTQFHTYDIPEVIKKKIVKLRTSDDRPYVLPDEREEEGMPKIPGNITLYDYQKDAINSWCDNGYHGLFQMATGTGKTFTSIGAYLELLKKKKVALVILVPYVHLLDQWKTECELFGLNPVLCGSSSPKWRVELRSAISNYKILQNNLCVIAVHKTASSDDFLRNIKRLPSDELMMIADEVHGLGSNILRGALDESYRYRLGLSATPSRWYDEDGTSTLISYFDKVCFEFSLKEAIDEGFLVPYMYYPKLIEVTEEEEYEIERLSLVIITLMTKLSNDSLTEKESLTLERTLRDRARIVKGSKNKFSVLRSHLKELNQNPETLEYSLFYVPDSSHKTILKMLKNENIFASQFIGVDSPQRRREVIKDFEEGMIRSIVAMKCLDEGVNVPSTKTAFFLASTTNPKEFIQRRGRVLRQSKRTGKKIAVIYDYIVIPRKNSSRIVSKYLLEREMPRFAEMVDISRNRFEAREIVRPILDHHQMLNLIDLKPWELYKLRQERNHEREEDDYV